MFQVNSIPQNNSGCNQVKPISTISLIFKTAISHFSKTIEEYSARQGVTRLTFVQSSIHTAAKFNVL